MSFPIKITVVAAVTVFLAGCVVAPYPPAPPPPPPGAVVVAPPPVAPPPGACCYSYSEYPPYYYGPSIGVGFGYYGGGRWGGWRGR